MRGLLEAVCERIIEKVDALTLADRAIGDGDHGVAMRRGFAAALERLDSDEALEPDAILTSVGAAVLAKAGGSAGAVFGTLFRSGGSGLAGDVLDANGFALFLEQGLEAIEKRGGAHPGQKTMLDALAPAAEAARKSVGEGLPAASRAAAAAAREGMERTKAMVATTGKAKTLGERSLGHADPGAVSMSLILDAMRDHIGRA